MSLKKILFAGIMMLTLTLTSESVTVHAEKLTYMEKLNINWDLRPDGVAIPYETYMAGIGYRTAGTIRFKTFEVEDIGNNKIHVKMKVIFKDKCKLTNKEIHKIANSGYDVKRYAFCTVVDLDTGKVAPVSGFSKNLSYYIYDSHGCKIQSMDDKLTFDFEMKKPSSGVLCVVAGGSTKKLLDDTTLTDDFHEGKVKFGKTAYVDKKNLQVAHAFKFIVDKERAGYDD